MIERPVKNSNELSPKFVFFRILIYHYSLAICNIYSHQKNMEKNFLVALYLNIFPHRNLFWLDASILLLLFTLPPYQEFFWDSRLNCVDFCLAVLWRTGSCGRWPAWLLLWRTVAIETPLGIIKNSGKAINRSVPP